MTEPTSPPQPDQPQQPQYSPPQSSQPPFAASMPAPVSPQDERTWSVVAHAGGIITSFIAPLVVWLIYRDRSRRLDHQGKEALNFQLTLLIAYVGFPIVFGIIAVIPIIGLLSFFGGLLIFATWAVGIIFGILGAVAASRDEWYTYPFKIPFIK